MFEDQTLEHDMRIDTVTIDLEHGDSVREIATHNTDFTIETRWVSSGIHRDKRNLHVTFTDDRLNEIIKAGLEALDSDE